MRRVLVVLLAVVPAFTACLAPPAVTPAGDALALDLPTTRPPTDWYNATGVPASTQSYGVLNAQTGASPFHTLEEVEARIAGWNATLPGFVEVAPIGTSRLGRAILDVVVTDESVPGDAKRTILIDGGHHGNENAGIEMSLYVVDFLLANAGRNGTIDGWLVRYEFHVVPIVNPDGYVAQTRGNALGVNLNRNYDIDWGDPLGASNPVMGTLAAATNRSMPSIAIVLENCGPEPFSEPETLAMRGLMERIGPRGALYLSHHTPTNALAAPWSAYDAPFPLPPEHDAVFESVLAWTRENADYRAGKAQWGNFSAGLPYSASGSSQDYYYAQWKVASFTLEVEIWYTSVLSRDYAQRVYLEPYAGLAYWMDATLPIPLYLIANADHFVDWTEPGEAPPLPAGTPPERLVLPPWVVKGDEERDSDPGVFFDAFGVGPMRRG